MNLQILGKAVHQPGELDALVFEAADQLVELFLRGHDDPELAAADSPERLDDPLQIEHLVDVPGDELADLVDHEEERLCQGIADPSALCTAARGGSG